MIPTFQNTKTIAFSIHNKSDADKEYLLFSDNGITVESKLYPQTLQFIKDINEGKIFFGVAQTIISVMEGSNSNCLKSNMRITFPGSDKANIFNFRIKPTQFQSNTVDSYIRYPLYKGTQIALTVLKNTSVFLLFNIAFSVGGTMEEMIKEPGVLNVDEKLYLLPGQVAEGELFVINNKLDQILEHLNKKE